MARDYKDEEQRGKSITTQKDVNHQEQEKDKNK